MMAGLILTAFSACSDLFPGMYASPALSWSTLVVRQCGVAPNGAASPACVALGECVRKRGQETLLDDRSDKSRYIAVVRAFYRIIPREDASTFGTAYTMPFLRERAERAGPYGMPVFDVMEDLRNTCLAETGLMGKIGYD